MNGIEVSIVLPCRNEKLYISNILTSINRALSSAGLDNNSEIIVVDGLSTDGTLDILSSLVQVYTNLKVLKNDQVTTPNAFNIGIAASSGKFVAILGVHWQIEIDYFSSLLGTLDATGADIVGGVVVAKGNETFTSQIIAFAMQNPISTGLGMRSSPNGQVITMTPARTVPGGLYRREALRVVGDFNVRLIRNQDDEWMARAKRAGLKIICNSSVKITYYCRSSFHSLAQQYFQYGYYKIYTLQPGFRFGPRQMLSLALPFYLIIAVIMAMSPMRNLGLGAIACYPIAILSQSLYRALFRKASPIFFLSGLATMIMQISYGIGIAVGFMNRKAILGH